MSSPILPGQIKLHVSGIEENKSDAGFYTKTYGVRHYNSHIIYAKCKA